MVEGHKRDGRLPGMGQNQRIDRGETRAFLDANASSGEGGCLVQGLDALVGTLAHGYSRTTRDLQPRTT